MSKTGKRTLTILMAFGLMIALEGLFSLAAGAWLLNQGKMAVGICTEVSYSRRNSTAIVQYEADGQMYSIKTGAGGMREGSTGVVHYPEGNPEDGRMIDMKDDLLTVLLGGATAPIGWKGKWKTGSGVRLSSGGMTFLDGKHNDIR